MDLATSIRLDCDTATLLTNGGILEVPIKALGDRGLPIVKTRLTTCTFKFEKFSKISFHEYAVFFKQSTIEKNNHSAWSIIDDGILYVIPALALIRAFAHPNKFFLQKIFKPQSLDDICTYIGPADGHMVQTIGRGSEKIRLNQTVTGPLSWFYCFPSARRAWASVYQSARKGALHFELPKATVTVKVRALKVGSISYVTQLKLQSIEVHERPFEFATGHPTYISKHFGRKRFTAGSSNDKHYKKLTQEEWNGIVPIFNSYQKTSRPGIDTRSLVDCILQRTSTNISWKSAAEFNNVSFGSATSAMRRWQADGRIERVINRLREMRESESKNSSISDYFHQKKAPNTKYQELSQEEWHSVSHFFRDFYYRGSPCIDSRSLVNCVWYWITFNVPLRIAADMNGIPLKRAEATIARWRNDGRYDRVVKRLSEICKMGEAPSSTLVQLGCRRLPIAHPLKLSDADWDVFMPLLATNAPPHKNPDSEIRALLNCVLQKLSSKISWQTAAKINSVPSARVQSALKRWKAQGQLYLVIERLGQLRNVGSK